MEHTVCPICAKDDFKHFLDVKDNMITKEDFKIVSCTSCGFHFTNPIPDEESIGRYYKSESYVSHSSSKKGLINSLYNLVRSYTLKRKVSLLQSLGNGKMLLDYGSGTGHFLNQAKNSGFQVRGLEPDNDARAFAKNEFGVDLDELNQLDSFEKESVDFISMWHVLEHVYHLQRDFTSLVSVLKKNGHLIIAVPNLQSYDAKYYGGLWAAYDVPRHLYHFRQQDIQELAKQHGLELIKVLPMKFDSYYVSMLSEKYKGGSIIKAFFVGLKSNGKSKSGGYSSQIYVLRKN